MKNSVIFLKTHLKGIKRRHVPTGVKIRHILHVMALVLLDFFISSILLCRFSYKKATSLLLTPYPFPYLTVPFTYQQAAAGMCRTVA